MFRKVFKTGNSMVVSIPKEMLAHLGMEAGSDVAIELDVINQQIIIRPAGRSLAGVNEDFARQLAEFIDEYRPVLEALAH